jgi:SNF2 family DNA or RNA helicase
MVLLNSTFTESSSIHLSDYVFTDYGEDEEVLLNKIIHIKISIYEFKKESEKCKLIYTQCAIENDRLKANIVTIRNKLHNIYDNQCPICMDTVNVACISSCCKNIFCMECISSWGNNRPVFSCPLCRVKISLRDLTIIDKVVDTENVPENVPENEPAPETKISSIIKILTASDISKVLIFSNFSGSFDDIMGPITNMGFKCKILRGSGPCIDNIINDFENGDTRVLCLNSKHYGAGLNLQMATDIIIYHSMPKNIEMQIIGRGQRPGRRSALNVTTLLYDHEIIT